jgi:putative hydrolase of the HAD superfamily
MPIRAVFFDFYGTLARATQWLSIDVVLAEHGYEMTDDLKTRWWAGDFHEDDHLEHSASRDDYRRWQHGRLLAMLAETDVHPGEYEAILEKLEAGASQRVLERYDETPEVLRTLREQGIARVVCSNWDWDLAEAVDEAGLTQLVDCMVSSAWAGARKPHPRIYAHTLAKAKFEPSDVLFVGDTWGPDVVGPRAAGMRPLYIRRDDHWPDEGAPPNWTDVGVAWSSNLRAVLDIVP